MDHSWRDDWHIRDVRADEFYGLLLYTSAIRQLEQGSELGVREMGRAMGMSRVLLDAAMDWCVAHGLIYPLR